MRPRPSRRAAGPNQGQCIECGQFSAYSPLAAACTRCALERMGDLGHQLEPDPLRRAAEGSELWRAVAHDLRSGTIVGGRFYLYVGYNDGGPLGVPMGDLSPTEWETVTPELAQQAALTLAERYAQVWVVTAAGCWNAVKPTTGDQS